MPEFLANLMMSDLFIPHGDGYLWNAQLVGLHLGSDLTIAIAYFSIPLTLFYFIDKRVDLPFKWIFSLFGVFIILCGATHLLEVWTLWHPVYWVSGGLKAVTAIVSAYTAAALIRLMPQALSLLSPAQLEAANRELQRQIQKREVAEAQIQQLNEELEARVAERTQELERSMQQGADLTDRLTLAIDAARLGICDWDIINQKINWNTYHEQLLGYPPGAASEYTDADWERRVHPEDLDRVKVAIDLAMSTRTDYTSEYRIVLPDGSVRWLDGFGRFYYDSSGSAIRMTGLAMDITDRKQDEANLRRSEEFNRRILENNKDCIKVLDLDGRLVYMNDGGKKLMEINDFASVDRSFWLDFWNASDLELARSAFAMAKGGKVSKFEGKCPTATGVPKWWQVTVAPIFDDLGNVEQILSISHDITDRIKSELAIAESEDRFRTTFEQAAVGVAHVALDGRWLLVNQQICEIVGYTEVELLNMDFQAITHPDDLAQDRENIRQIMAGEIRVIKFEKRYIHKQGHTVWINLTGTLRYNDAGEPLYFIASFENINDRKQAEFALQAQTITLARTTALAERRNRELDQFAHIVSHDLKAPLRAIANLSEWIEEDLEGKIEPETQTNLELMRSRVYRMENLINGLLDYARVGQTPASLTAFSVEDLLTEIVDSLNIPPSFMLELPTNLPSLTSNRILLSQVFANLIGNACKHHDRPDGRIQITAESAAQMWTFCVTDDGPGIAAPDQERAFGIFQTLAARDKKENTGIGLSIVKKIVESQGGKISIVSPTAAGNGTTFRFTWKDMGGVES